jgi:hypothetical protein
MHTKKEYTDPIHFLLIALFISSLDGNPDVETSALEIIIPTPQKEGYIY